MMSDPENVSDASGENEPSGAGESVMPSAEPEPTASKFVSAWDEPRVSAEEEGDLIFAEGRDKDVIEFEAEVRDED